MLVSVALEAVVSVSEPPEAAEVARRLLLVVVVAALSVADARVLLAFRTGAAGASEPRSTVMAVLAASVTG